MNPATTPTDRPTSVLIPDVVHVKERPLGSLSTVVPGVVDVQPARLGPIDKLRSCRKAGVASGPSEFHPTEVSYGTPRAFGALVAVAQLANGATPVKLVGIEEPETALHPSASGALMDALREAAVRTQVVVTTHSPDLLDEIDPATACLLVARCRDVVTEIGPIDRASRKAVEEHLYSLGQLLRTDQPEVSPGDLSGRRQARPALAEAEVSG